VGITAGLFHFDTDPDQIKTSIQGLLEGLKAAFLTSIVGIGLSLIFGKIVKYKLNLGLIPDPPSREATSLELIQGEIKRLVEQINIFGKLQKGNINDILKRLEDNSDAIRDKIDEFAENLAKNNSEALMKAIQGVIEDFNDTFKNFIGELVNKNFEKLSESIDQLVTWQKDYRQEITDIKEGYQSLVSQFSNFLGDAEKWMSLTDKITTQNKALTELVKELQGVMIEDKKFTKIISAIEKSAENISLATDNLVEHGKLINDAAITFESTGEHVKSIAESVDNTEGKISTWLERENGVQESVIALQSALSELRNFDISHLEDLNETFNMRLAGTFTNLDKLIKEYIIYLENKNYNERAA
jgi:DNA repair ATPase RecN